MTSQLKKILILLLCCTGLPAAAAVAVEFDATPLIQQAGLYLDEGRLLECVDAWHQVYQYSNLPEEQALGLTRVADVLALFLNQKEQALTLYHQARSEYDTPAVLENAFFNAGMLEYELNQPEAARISFSRFAELYPASHRLITAQYMLQRIADETPVSPPPPPPPAPDPVKPPIPAPKMPAPPVPPAVPEVPVVTPAPVPTPKEPELLETAVPQVRVALEQAPRVTVQFRGPVTARVPAGQQQWPAGEYQFVHRNGQLHQGDTALGREVVLIPTQDRFYWQEGAYHGLAHLRIIDNQVLLVNHLPLELYLEGVVPREMPASWELEALKAQAVSARSYAYYIVLRSEDKSYDVAATTASQVYGGADQGNANSRRAVSETLGQILMHNQQPVLTYFHSHSGGVLEDAGLVWSGSSLPYYQVRPDDVSQQFRPLDWKAQVAATDVAAALRRNGFNVRQVTDLQAAKTSASGRLVEVKAITDGGNVTLRANSLRLWLGATQIRSVLTSIEKKGDGFEFQGRGYGHGVGMSQWGAQGMARQGAGYAEILAHYYPNTTLQAIYR